MISSPVIPGCASAQARSIPDADDRAPRLTTWNDEDHDLHYDALETRDPAEREGDLFSRLPDVLRKAMAAPAYAERLKGIDPAAITSRAALARLPVLRKSELPCPAQGRAAIRRLCHRSRRLVRPPVHIARPDLRAGVDAHAIHGAARGRCSPPASGRATWC